MKVIFHFGPPKTGTSAIQKWASLNHDWLKEQGVYYPPHEFDVNGVSSGNLQKVIAGKRGSFQFSKSLYEAEVFQARQAGCHTLLFSSEFFFENLKLISEHVPHAKFLGYVRFGLEILQSSYNQAVKRHGKITEFSPHRSRYSTLSMLSKRIEHIGEDRFILRPYSKLCFRDNSLIADFLSVLQVDYSRISTSVGRVNPSYCLESIEVKRWFNQLESGGLHVQLDLALQSYGDGEVFSLFSDEQYKKFKESYLAQLKCFLDNHQVADADKFYAECCTLDNFSPREQKLSSDEFQLVVSSLIRQNKISLNTLYDAYLLAREKKPALVQPERVEVLKKLLPLWIRILFKLRKKLSALNKNKK